jgi:eukaryotic-like serine/threonine-protein kinase
MRDLVVGDRLDQYELQDLLARSGMASIFKATDTLSGATVALKVPHVQYESDVVFSERFRREEEVGQRLDHPNLVKILKPAEKSRMYMAMEYVDGRSLRALMTGKAPIATDLALDVARQVLDALQYLHEEGVVHRDIKPENVLLAPGNRVKILDFGIALFASERRLTWAGFSNTVGTPDYMAPEQIRGRRGDPRTDVYAVGTLLYEMLTCNLPFESANPRALMNAKANDEPRPPSYYVPGFDPSLETIILRAIEREPRARYATARQMLRDVENPSAVAPRDPSAGRSRRRGQRLRRRVIVGVALAAALTGLGWLMRLTYVRTVESGRAPAASQRGR